MLHLHISTSSRQFYAAKDHINSLLCSALVKNGRFFIIITYLRIERYRLFFFLLYVINPNNIFYLFQLD